MTIYVRYECQKRRPVSEMSSYLIRLHTELVTLLLSLHSFDIGNCPTLTLNRQALG